MHVVSSPAAFFHIACPSTAGLNPQGPRKVAMAKLLAGSQATGLSARKASKVLSLPRSTLYRWQRQLKGYRLKGLEDKSRRPKRLRHPMWNPKMV